jgi:hypothetical protein
MSIYSMELAIKQFSNLLTVVTSAILLAFTGLFSHFIIKLICYLVIFHDRCHLNYTFIYSLFFLKKGTTCFRN